ncbi:prenyltransferase [Brachybacterium sp. FME24]|uniref:prenyltransferase n=1 Tax=Brachybacterium sp. FME24 TaxID=2742605 RepID=UPI001868D272|nr:prenyltransferase [Brachybacterium sp. FME24]
MTAATAAPGMARQLLGTSRPLSWINTAYPFAAAYLLAGGQITATLVLGTVFFLVPYNLLMYGINDVFDHESDLRNPRKGGVEGIVLDRRWHTATAWAAGLLAAPFVLALIAWGSIASTLILTVVLAAVVAYSVPGLRLKERPVLDSVTSSTHFVGPAAVGLALTGAPWGATALAALSAFFLWGMASHAFGAVQDIVPDREAGIGSIATVLGAHRTVLLSSGLYAGAGAVMLTTGWPAALASLLVIPYVVSIWRYRGLTDEHSAQAHPGWRRFLGMNLVAGFLLTQLLIWILLRG